MGVYPLYRHSIDPLHNVPANGSNDERINMRLRKTLFGVMAGTALALGGMAAPAQAAAAAPAPADAAAHASVAPPSLPDCLHTRTWDDWHHAYVEVHNTCSTAYRFRIAWEGATDSQCWTLHPGQKRTDSAAEPAWFGGLYRC